MIRRIAAALAFAVAGLAAPAIAQVPSSVPNEIEVSFLNLRDPLIENIGTSDTVIMFYAEFDRDIADPGTHLIVRFRTPEGVVRTQGIMLGPVVGKLFAVANAAYRRDPSWRSATLVIDHGRATVTMRYIRDFDAAKTLDDNKAAETARVFPGLKIEPYKGPGS